MWSNAPHIADRQELGYQYILGAKPGDHKHLFDRVIDAGDDSKLHSIRTAKIDKKGSYRETQWAKKLPLNKSNPDVLVNYVGPADLTSDVGINSYFHRVSESSVGVSERQSLGYATLPVRFEGRESHCFSFPLAPV